MSTPQLRITDADPVVRRIAIRELADESDPADVPLIIHALRSDDNAIVRAEAASALDGWEDEAAVDALCAALPDDAVRAAASSSLANLKRSESGMRVLPWTVHSDPQVRAAALRAVRELRLPGSLEPALDAATHTDPLVRREAAAVLGWLRDKAALPLLTRLVAHDEDADVRRTAAGTLGMSYDEDARDALVAALGDPGWQVREEAAATLGKLRHPHPHVAAGLVDVLRDEWWQVSLQAARALGKIRASVAVPALIELLSHPLSNLRKETAIALGEIGDARAVPALEIATQDSDPDVRKLARLALTAIVQQARV